MVLSAFVPSLPICSVFVCCLARCFWIDSHFFKVDGYALSLSLLELLLFVIFLSHCFCWEISVVPVICWMGLSQLAQVACVFLGFILFVISGCCHISGILVIKFAFGLFVFEFLAAVAMNDSR